MMGMRRMRRFADDLTGRSYGATIAIVGRQIDAATLGAYLARDASLGQVPTTEARSRMVDIEHAGDAERASLINALSRAITTPIDRADLFRLSRSVDDVLDNLRDYVRELDLYKVHENLGAVPLLEAITEGLSDLHTAVMQVNDRAAEVRPAAHESRRHGNDVRKLYQQQMAELFTQDFGIELMKRRELLRRLDVIGLRMIEATSALVDGMLKRSH